MYRTDERFVRRMIVAAVVLGSFMGATDSSIVIIALTSISRYFDVGTSAASWVLIIYLLVITGFLIPFGRLGDVWGRKKIFVAGFAIFTAGSFFCGASGSLPELILFRAVQGIGGAMIIATGSAILSVSLPAQTRGRGLGYLSLANGLGLAAGFGIGGIIVHFLSWQWIFFMNVPVGLFALIIACIFIPGDTVQRTQPPAFDFAGALLVILSAGLFTYALSLGEEMGWHSVPIIGAIILSGICSLLFITWEKHTPSPLLQLGMLKNPGISAGIGAAMFNRLVLSGMTFLIPIYLEIVKGYSTGFTGLLLLAPSLLIIFTGPTSGALSDRIGSRRLCVLAGLFLFLSVGIFVIFDNTIALVAILTALAFRGISMGLFSAPNLRLVLSSTPEDDQGSAASLWYFSRYLSSTIGIVIFEMIFDHWIRKDVAPGTAGAVHLVSPIATVEAAFDTAFMIGVIFVIVMIILTLLIREGKEHCEPADFDIRD
ncbi:MFS transporter [Methanogenium organophilum]|uniref:MFS transporter n=1 Tax=Methanogenium organophilum TaxID=2199 RepID=A0A9X9S5B1_METOG|nr:MFS transporter [Methanogenium organophilum]WAI02194.1 MFS transporter [Methanogenium organophilum]